MNLDFAKKRDFWIFKTKVGAQKIDGLKLDTFGMVIAFLLVENKEEKSHFFKKTFLLVDISMDITMGMLFFTLNNVEVNFVDCHFH